MTPGPSPPRRRIARWKIVGGAALHFAPVVYLIAAGVDAIWLAAGPAPWAGSVLTGVLRDSVPGLAIYAVLGAGTTLLALAIDKLAGPGVPSPSGALAEAKGRFGPQADAALAELAVLPAQDERTATLLRHGDCLARSALDALDAALPERRGAIIERTTAALETLAEEARMLRAEAGAEREARAAALAGFVAARYRRSTLDGSSDSAGE